MRSSFILFTWFLLFTGFSNPGESFPVLIADIPHSPNQTVNQNIPINELQEGTPVPEITSEASDPEYPEAHNPGLVFGAIILVLIIIGGVIINSRVFKKK
jgi:hypothetical protein